MNQTPHCCGSLTAAHAGSDVVKRGEQYDQGDHACESLDRALAIGAAEAAAGREVLCLEV